ncbi:uncharacterized protein C9orf57 homolog [Eulemur rufifrons]|uniref:uncharacterized protein C9orf57 homolog n=1 Tax=Eulemur rufifrons TaxID=859984 RepID=UPI0037444BE8
MPAAGRSAGSAGRGGRTRRRRGAGSLQLRAAAERTPASCCPRFPRRPHSLLAVQHAEISLDLGLDMHKPQKERQEIHLGETGNVICRSCKLSIAFHGCLLDYGTCRTKPGQYCKKQIYNKGGIEWYSTKGCTENKTECFQKIKRSHGIYSTHCCRGSLCNF